LVQVCCVPGTNQLAQHQALVQVSEIMTRKVETIAPDASLQQVASAMEAIGVGSLPVPDGERLVGDRDIVVRGVAVGLSPVDGPVRDCMTEEIAILPTFRSLPCRH
jgi:CBS domain-containing protein